MIEEDLSAHERARGKLPQLQRGDIVMIRHRKSMFRWFLRRFMKSYFDHTALVLYPSELARNRYSTIVIESIRTGTRQFSATRRGVDIHRLDRYLSRPDRYEIGIKRVKGLTQAERTRATHFMLMNVDAPYWPWKHLSIVLAACFPELRKEVLLEQRFSCSGIIQKAFYDAVNWNEKQRVLLKEGIWSPIELQELVSPGDIETSSRTIWVYNKPSHVTG